MFKLRRHQNPKKEIKQSNHPRPDDINRWKFVYLHGNIYGDEGQQKKIVEYSFQWP